MENAEFRLINFFKSNYETYISEIIIEIDKATYSIDISKYTSEILLKAENIIQQFMISENIENLNISLQDNFIVNSQTFLLSIVNKEKCDMDNKLFVKIFEHNTTDFKI